MNEKIINLSNPLITEEGKELVELYYKETLDPEGRGYKNLIKMMQVKFWLFKIFYFGTYFWFTMAINLFVNT